MKKIIIWVVIIAIIVIGAVVWSGNNQQAKSFNLGLIAILSGDYAAVGENIRNGVVLASEEYNQAHPDAKINVFMEDDGFNGGKGLSAYQKLITSNQIQALINVSTPTIDAIYGAVTTTDLPVIQMGEQGREPADDNVLGILPNSIASEYEYGVYMREKGVKEMAIVYSNIDAMVRFVESFKQGFQGTTTDFVIQADEKDLRPHALKVAASNSSTIGLFIVPQQGARFMQEFLKIKKNNPQFFFDTNFQSGFSDYQRILGDMKVLDGTIVGTVKSDVADEFKAKYKARFNADPGFLSDIGYDAFNLLVATYDANQATWVKNLKAANFAGVGGKIEFDGTGNRKPETKIMAVKGGQLTDLE